ncbi:MAG: PQQ-binding-like beta-propeller repeat protein [Actinomycetota bacterium]|nr:PQQ-binding-like beta-propeller repeat protein [Actinomycetota bacterium]
MPTGDSPDVRATDPETDDGALTEFTGAIARVAAGESVVVIAETNDGSASRLVGLIPEEVSVFSRVMCAAACRASVGGVAEDLHIDEYSGGAVVLEDAQWADPTSLGRLQRLIKDGPHPYLLIITHRPFSGVDGWWIDQLVKVSRRHAALVEITLEAEDAAEPAGDLDPLAADLVTASHLVTGPISVPVASLFVELDEAELLDVGDALVSQGLLGQARGGYLSAPGSSSIVEGDARAGYVAGRLATAMEESGGDAAVIGGLRMSAGQPTEAFPLLAEAAQDAERRHATGEAFHLAEAALEAAEEAGLVDESQLGELHLICGRFLRTAGRTEWAGAHLEKATSGLEGLSRVEALSFAAAVADDGQHPQEAERIIAVAEWEAIRLGEETKLGSLLAFHARVLNRIGFAEEADAALVKSGAILEEGATPGQLFDATVNKAWIHFDRGEASLAEKEFTQLRDQAGQLEGDASVADKEAWRARALFASGRPADALEAIRTVEELAQREDVEAPLFLAQLALTEGNLALGRYEEALDAAEHVLDLVERQLPAWENMARSHRASAYLRLGRIDEAREEIAAALEASPPGSNGWRWRVRCQALQMEIAASGGERWPAREAEDLADLMLQSRLYGWAAELLCAIAEHGKRKGAASEALALATQVGLPMVAARAAEAGSLWRDPAAAHTILAIGAIEKQIPTGWLDAWRAMPQVNEALAAPEPVDDETFEAATEAMDQALRKAGLAAGEVALSPAQRRSGGLVRRPRRIHPLRLAAAALGIVVVAGGTALGVAELTKVEVVASPTPTSVAPEVTTTVPLTLEETLVPIPAGVDFFFGVSEHRGDPGRSGVLEWQGPRDVAGYYWKYRTAGPIEAGLVTYGKNVYVGTTEGTFYALDQTSGDERWTMKPEGRISTAPAFGRFDIGQGADPMIMVVVDDAGIVRGHDATSDQAVLWVESLGARIRSSPVIVDGVAIVATTEGFIYGLHLREGNELWKYPDGDQGIGLVTADLAYDEGTLYVGTQEGILHVIDVSTKTPQPICEFDAINAIVANPLVVDDVVYVGTVGQNVWALPPRSCDGSVANRQFVYAVDAPVTVAPAMVGDIMYLPEGRFLYARNLATNEFLWAPGTVAVAEAPISSPPVVAGEAVYFASEDGVVHAVDAQTGETLWTWETGLHVRGALAVVDGVVFVAGGDGFIYAIGPGGPVEPGD